MTCEDFPACGHEPGCCPDFDESGKQLNMVCTCGAKLPLSSKVSICRACLNRMAWEDGEQDDFMPEEGEDQETPEDFEGEEFCSDDSSGEDYADD